MGERGPVPNRSEERRRRNKTSESGESLEVDKVEVNDPRPEAPPAPEHWHPMALATYLAACQSPQSRFYEASDYAALGLLCEGISRDLKPQPVPVGSGEDAHIEMLEVPIKGANLSAYLKLMASLLLTEGDRRRLRVEIERKNAVDAVKKTSDGVVLDRKALFARGKK